MRKTARVFILTLVLLTLSFFPKLARADLTFCSVNIVPTSVRPSSSTQFDFNVINNSVDTQIKWIKISRPSGDFTLGAVTTDWNIVSSDSENVILNGGGIDPTYGGEFIIGVAAGPNEAASADWKIKASADDSGTPYIDCTGDLGTSISASAPSSDKTPPNISSIVVSDVSDTSVKISWVTDEDADSTLDYGLYNGFDSSYESTKTDASLTTAHSFTLSGLTANTTYHYNIKDSDGSGNLGQSGDNTFVTAKTGTTGTTQAGTTTTRIITGTPTPTTRPLVDTVAPVISLNTDFSKPFTESPKITGKASDAGSTNVGVAKVEYSIDDGKNWLPADGIDNVNAISTAFDFTPAIFEDGNYKVKVRATDKTGNLGYSSVKTMVIDRLPPQVGGVLFSIGPQVLIPTKEGVIFTLQSLKTKITLSAVGGATTIDIVSSPLRQSSSEASTKTFSLTKNSDNGLWSGVLDFDEPGIYELTAKAVDGADNRTERKLNTVVVLGDGKVVSSSSSVTSGDVTLWYYDNQTQRFVVWDGAPYGQANPQKITKNGGYGFFAPSGKYYLEVKSFGFKTLRTEIFTLDASMPITTKLSLKASLGLRFGSFVIPLPDFSVSKQSVIIKSPAMPSQAQTVSDVIGKEFSSLDLFLNAKKVSTISLRGKPTVFTFLSTWSPYASEQLKFVGELSGNPQINMVPVISQESSTFASVFSKRGGYSFPIYSDPDGLLIKPLNLSFLPTSIFVNRKGVIQNVKVGILTKDELMENLAN
jgi:hypothetical protein